MYFRIVYKSQTRGAEPLHSCASLQVLFDLGRVFAVETLCLLVELGVPLVDVIDVGVVVVGPASAVLGPFLDPAKKKKKVWYSLRLCHSWLFPINETRRGEFLGEREKFIRNTKFRLCQGHKRAGPITARRW